jgi:hypothetical protein
MIIGKIFQDNTAQLAHTDSKAHAVLGFGLVCLDKTLPATRASFFSSGMI